MLLELSIIDTKLDIYFNKLLSVLDSINNHYNFTTNLLSYNKK